MYNIVAHKIHVWNLGTCWTKIFVEAYYMMKTIFGQTFLLKTCSFLRTVVSSYRAIAGIVGEAFEWNQRGRVENGLDGHQQSDSPNSNRSPTFAQRLIRWNLEIERNFERTKLAHTARALERINSTQIGSREQHNAEVTRTQQGCYLLFYLSTSLIFLIYFWQFDKVHLNSRDWYPTLIWFAVWIRKYLDTWALIWGGWGQEWPSSGNWMVKSQLFWNLCSKDKIWNCRWRLKSRKMWVTTCSIYKL